MGFVFYKHACLCCFMFFSLPLLDCLRLKIFVWFRLMFDWFARCSFVCLLVRLFVCLF